MRIIFAGSPSCALPVLSHLHLDTDHQIVGVLARPDARKGRGQKLTSAAVASYAKEHDLALLQPHRLSDPGVYEEIASWNAQLAVVVAYGVLLDSTALSLLPHGWVNVHFSLLPKYRGAAPVQRALIAGDKETGVSVFQIEPSLDTGPIYASQSYPIPAEIDSGELLDFLAHESIPLVDECISKIVSNVAPIPQNSSGISMAPRLSSKEAQICWAQSAETIINFVRGFNPNPGPWTQLSSGVRLKVHSLKPVDDSSLPVLAPGSIIVSKKTVMVGTGSANVFLGEVSVAGKSRMLAADWARGARLSENDRFVF